MAAVLMCGTDIGYRQHLKTGDPPCDDCRAAHARRRREQRWRAGQSQPMPRAACGTISGYQAHFRRGEERCRACVDAQNAYSRRWRLRRRDPVSISEAVVDVLSTQDRWLPRDVAIALILDLHAEWNPKSISRALFRLATRGVIDGRIMQRERTSAVAEYRADMTAWERL